MKIFEQDGKINFVDKNNIFVGYDLRQGCCENADWFISAEKENKIYDNNWNNIDRDKLNVDDYSFDVEFFEEVNDCPDLDDGGMVRFRLVNGEQELFLHLFNCHNGYYGHGFEFKIGDKVIKEDCL